MLDPLTPLLSAGGLLPGRRPAATSEAQWFLTPPAAYFLAAALAGGMLLARVAAGRAFEGPTMIVFTVPILLSAYWGGLGPGLLATLISTLGASYYLLAPILSFAVFSTMHRMQILVLLFTGGLISLICRSLHRARRRAESGMADAQHAAVISAHLAAIVNSSADAIIGKTLQGIVTSWNAGAQKLFGYEAAEMIGQSIARLIPPDRQEEEAVLLGQIQRGESVRHFATRRVRKDGQAVDISVSISPIKDADGQIVGASKVAHDITEQNRANALLLATRDEISGLKAESEVRFQTMANSIPQLAWIARADGYITWYNRRWYEYTGMTPGQTEGWDWQSVHDPKMLPWVMKQWMGAIASGEVFEMEFPLRGVDGKFRAFLTRVQPLKDAEGKVMQWFGTNTDVETLRQAGEAVRQSERNCGKSSMGWDRTLSWA